MSDPQNPGEVTVTIKYGKGHDESWSVFRGSVESVTANLASYFGLDYEQFDTPHDLTLEATALAHGSTAAANGAGGRAIKKSESKSEPKATDESASKATPEPAKEEKPPSPLLDRIKEAKTRDELKKMWAANKADFDSDADLMKAWRDKGKSLPA